MLLDGARFVWLCLVLSLLLGGLEACTDPQPAQQVALVWPTPYPTVIPGQPVALTLNGYTITLYPLSADPSRAVISYTIAGPAQPPLAATWLGRAWRDDWMFSGPRAHVQAPNVDLPVWSPLPGKVNTDQAPPPSDPDATHLWAFDTAALAQLPPVLPLQITGDLFANLPPKYESVYPFPQERPLAADWHFEVAVPVNPRRRLAIVQQSVSTSTVTVTLEQVVVAASETRLYLHTSAPGYNLPTWHPEAVELQIGAWRGRQADERLYPQQGLGGSQQGQDNWVALYPDALLERQGEWTVTIPTMATYQYDVGQVAAGPWVFHFQVPAPTNLPTGP